MRRGTPSRVASLYRWVITESRSATSSVRSAKATEAFERVFHAQYRGVFRYVLALTGNVDDADDVAAETFARALKAWAGSPPDHADRWLLLTARRIATDRWRRARGAVRLSHRSVPGANSALQESESWIWLNRVLALLPPRQREVLMLRYERDLSDADIATIMGLSESGVRSLAARAIATLRDRREVWDASA
jgi:RNA polymerase sigma factor (sigma-70 family)